MENSSQQNLPQIFMRHPNLSEIRPPVLADGCVLHSHTEGLAENQKWEDLIEASFKQRYAFEQILKNWHGYKSEYVFYLNKDGMDISTASAVENSEFLNEGYIHMVATLPGFQGHGAGRSVVTAALYSLATRGFKTAVLSTDDERLSAIKLYYSLGFRPFYTHESHEKRWSDIFNRLGLN